MISLGIMIRVFVGMIVLVSMLAFLFPLIGLLAWLATKLFRVSIGVVLFIVFLFVIFSGVEHKEHLHRGRKSVAKAVDSAVDGTTERVKKPNSKGSSSRARRAKRQAPQKKEEPLEMPPRAAEIPVSAELARAAEPQEQPTTILVSSESIKSNDVPEKPAELAEIEAFDEIVAEPVDFSAATAQEKMEEVIHVGETPVIAAREAAEPKIEAVPEPVKSTPEVSDSVPAVTVTEPTASTPAPPAERPDWVDAPARLTGEVYRISVRSGPYTTVGECQRALELEVRSQTNRYIDDYLGRHAARSIHMPLEYLQANVVKQQYPEVLQSASVGPMQQIHALLEFNDDTRREFKQRWESAIVARRLAVSGAAAGGLFAVLCAAFGLLKFRPKDRRVQASMLMGSVVVLATLGFALFVAITSSGLMR